MKKLKTGWKHEALEFMDKLRQQILDEIENDTNDYGKEEWKPWRAEKGEDYFYISQSNDVMLAEEINSIHDDCGYAAGNYFQTKEEALQVARLEAARHRLWHIAKYVNGGVYEWQTLENNYYIFYDHYSKTLDVGYFRNTQGIDTYFKSEEAARQAIELLYDEDKITLFGGK